MQKVLGLLSAQRLPWAVGQFLLPYLSSDEVSVSFWSSLTSGSYLHLSMSGTLSFLTCCLFAQDLRELWRVSGVLRGRVLQRLSSGMSWPEGDARGEVHLHRV